MPEVWRLDEQTLTLYRLVDGDYQVQETSIALPLWHRDDLFRFWSMSQTRGETSWVKALRQWLRERLAGV